MARPDRPSVAYIGDGAWGMSLAEVLTCVRENIPAIAVVSAIHFKEVKVMVTYA